MTDRYVGPGGNDGSDGLSWANRKLTLNGVEDTPVVAGDTVYVGPGVYREELTPDVSGDVTGGPITYIGDVSGENTDSIGGIVRITGSNDDQSQTRGECIQGFIKNYRTFRGFFLDIATRHIDNSEGTNWIIEDCAFAHGSANAIRISEAGTQSPDDCIIRRCFFLHQFRNANNVQISGATDQSNTGILIENLLIVGGGVGVAVDDMGDVTIKNVTMMHTRFTGVTATSIPGGQTVNVDNSIFQSVETALSASVTGEIVEDFNTFYGNATDRTNVAVGGNSVTYPALFTPPIFLDGIKYPWWFGELSEWSQVTRIAGSSESADDLFGVVRPTTSAKKSWGTLQLREAERETGTVQTGSAALTLADAGDHQIYVPVTATSTTFEVGARYESEYAGTLPRLIVRQPGQADQVDTMVAAADTWETLSLTFTPNATPPYVVVIFRSLNTSVTGDFDTYWDDLDVS